MIRHMKWPQGVVFPAVSDDRVGRLCARGECYETDVLRDMRRRIRSGTAIDVGAHLGNHTVWLAGVCGLRVVAFEPKPELVIKLRVNVAANHLEDRVTIYNVALGRKSGLGRMEGIRLIRDGKGPVAIGPLDDWLLTDVGLIKIDVEGTELEVLEGAENTIARCRPIVYVEGDREELDAWMILRGYRCFGRFATTPVYGYRS